MALASLVSRATRSSSWVMRFSRLSLMAALGTYTVQQSGRRSKPTRSAPYSAASDQGGLSTSMSLMMSSKA